MSSHESTPAQLPAIVRDRDNDYGPEIIEARRALCRGQAGGALRHLEGASVAAGEARGNVENFIGFAQVPVGIAGPLLWHGEGGSDEVYVPMATTEGALVASHTRGMRMLRAAGGVRTRVVGDALSQHPILRYRDFATAEAAARRVGERRSELEVIVAGLSKHGRLLSVVTEHIGRRMILRLGFHTGDAIGINMATRAADACMRAVAEWTGAEECQVHGQDLEKRANARSLVEGRGRSVIAEAILPRRTLAEIGRTTPELMVACMRSYATGFAQLGTQNWMIQNANGLAAIFTACGQDIAYVGECATGFLDVELDAAGDLYVAATLPSLLIGTVGGGSGQGTAVECLRLMGCAGQGKVRRFAEIIAATVLAGDLSLLAAFTSAEFVAAHEQLGRNRPSA